MKFEVVGIDCPCVDLAVNVDVIRIQMELSKSRTLAGRAVEK